MRVLFGFRKGFRLDDEHRTGCRATIHPNAGHLLVVDHMPEILAAFASL